MFPSQEVHYTHEYPASEMKFCLDLDLHLYIEGKFCLDLDLHLYIAATITDHFCNRTAVSSKIVSLVFPLQKVYC